MNRHIISSCCTGLNFTLASAPPSLVALSAPAEICSRVCVHCSPWHSVCCPVPCRRFFAPKSLQQQLPTISYARKRYERTRLRFFLQHVLSFGSRKPLPMPALFLEAVQARDLLTTSSFFDQSDTPAPRFLLKTQATRPVEANTDSVDDNKPFPKESQTLEEFDLNGTGHITALQSQQPQKGQLRNRIVFGLGIGIGILFVTLAGGWVFSLALAACILLGTEEYFELVRSKGIARGMAPPPLFVTHICSAICAAMPIMTLYFGGRMGVAVTTAAFLLATVLLLQRGSPRFSQLSSAIFGLFYCGYLPSFWVKLRCTVTVPAINTKIVTKWPVLLGGPFHWTVGLVATLISFSIVIAADTGAFLGGKALGKTPLTIVSPKKTLEGTAIGLASAVVMSVFLANILNWPSSISSAAAMAVLVFLGSLFGDLTESLIKRDAGVKDSGRLIPGHGGMLDRVDSYIFTGALVYSFVKIALPLFGA